jgi:hypothetical protein
MTFATGRRAGGKTRRLVVDVGRLAEDGGDIWPAGSTDSRYAGDLPLRRSGRR